MAGDKPETGSEVLLGWLILTVIILICFYVMYITFTPEIHGVLRWIRYGELWVISLFTPDSYTVSLPSGEEYNLADSLDILTQIPREKLSVDFLAAVTGVAMGPIKYITMFIIALIGLWSYRNGPGTQYTEIFDLTSFIRFQSQNFPIISPFIKYNPNEQAPRPPGSKVPAELPHFAEALGPEEWLAYHQIPIKDKDIDKNAAFKAFSRQLGPRWQGVKNLAPYKQILLAGFCLKASRKREASDELMGRLARCWSHDKGLQLNREPGLLKEARKILKNKDLAYKVLKNCSQHAFQTTALLRGLLTAREEGGVMAPAQFVWLRAHDRDLWYPLNNLGRQSNHSEAIGAVAHFKQERRVKRPIPKPKMQEAVTSMIEYMNGSNVRPIPELDYSQSKNKRGIKQPKQAKA